MQVGSHHRAGKDFKDVLEGLYTLRVQHYLNDLVAVIFFCHGVKVGEMRGNMANCISNVLDHYFNDYAMNCISIRYKSKIESNPVHYP